MGETILVVDDDARIRKRLSSFLKKEGFEAIPLAGGAELRAYMQDGSADLVILDLSMPGEDGLSLTRYLREHFNLGILILTGKGEPVDRVVGLEMGADDYLGKPFNMRELLARIRSIVRRLGGPQASQAAPHDPPEPAPSDVLAFDRFRLDLARHRLSDESGAEIVLTGTEFNLLAALCGNANRPLSRDQLLDAVAGRDWQPFDRSIDLHISHLRKKLGDDPKRPAFIRTVRGAGYVFACPVATGAPNRDGLDQGQ